ncbi:hypothetical protein KKG71_03320 [Patescibacteria group bacterium]|nr:hypothetical protein [Patescibacteria group bacterium]
MPSRPKQDIESKSTIPHQPKTAPKRELFDKDYFSGRKKEQELKKLREKDEKAYFYWYERERLKKKLQSELAKLVQKAPDLSLVEKKEVLNLIKKMTEDELSNLKETIIKDGIKEGIAEYKQQSKFTKGTQSSD